MYIDAVTPSIIPSGGFAGAGVNGNFARWRDMTLDCKRLLTFEARRNQRSLVGRWPTTLPGFSVLEEPQRNRRRVSSVVSGVMKTQSLDINRYFSGDGRIFPDF